MYLKQEDIQSRLRTTKSIFSSVHHLNPFWTYHDKNLSKKRANFNDIEWTRNWHTWTMTYKIPSDFCF